MNVLNRWTRPVIALAAVAAVVPFTATAGAAPARTATTTSYTNATYLQHALGLPPTDTDPAIESVTYDRFQWLLQQPGRFAFLIGDPATDQAFDDRAQEVEAKAKQAGVKHVYWFNPNLSGSAVVGTIQEPAIDIRNPTAITQLTAASQTTYGDAWRNLISRYLGNGVTTTLVSGEIGDEDPKITTAANHPENVNDYGSAAGYSTKVGDKDGGALYDYSSATPANATHSFFVIYDKDRTVTPDGSSTAQPAKIAAWVDLTDKGSAAADDVAKAITAGGGASLTSLDQFAWWKDSVNWRQTFTSTAERSGLKVPVLTDADNAASEGGWRINQVTYPELVDLLENGADSANAVILFGGTWCPNTRPVLPFVNKYAQENDVQVFNFDTVLDGATVGGSATNASNPLQSRNTATNNSSVDKSNPSFLYGDVLDQYLTNIKTQYDPASTYVNYHKGGGADAALTRTRKLQVPFVIGYKGQAGDAPNAGITRQWIIDKGNGSYLEYMSYWYYTNPQPNQLNLNIPLDAAIWPTINSQLASFTWQSDPKANLANTAIVSDAGQFLGAADTAKVTYTPANGTTPASLSTPVSGGPIVISPAALASAVTRLGASLPANAAAAKTALLAAYAASPQVQTQIDDLTTVYAAWTITANRKTSVNTAWGTANTAGGVTGGLNAVHALDVFFGGLPGGVVSRRTVTADPARIAISIANDYGRVPTGNVSLVVTKGGATVASASTAVANNAASFTLPVLDAGTYDYTLSYPGDDQIAAFTDAGSLTVPPPAVSAGPPPPPAPLVVPATITRVKPSKVAGAVAKAPTSRKAGKYKVTITTPKGRSQATGKVTIKLKKGKVTKTITGKLSHGKVTVSVPKLARGTWKVTISWPGDSSYRATSVTGASIKVKK